MRARSASVECINRSMAMDSCVYQHFGRLDAILYNAGYGYMSAVEEIDLVEAQANFDTNVFGTLSVIQAALPFLRDQRSGHIITLSSIGMSSDICRCSANA